MILLATIRDDRGEGNGTVYVQARNAAAYYWNFTSLVWQAIDASACHKFLLEYQDGDAGLSRYQAQVDLPVDGSILEYFRSSNGILRFLGEDDLRMLVSPSLGGYTATLPKLYLTPDSNSYGVKDGKEVISVQLDGGASRFRRDVVGASSTISVKWTVDADGYRTLRDFYESIGNGAEPFLIDLIWEDADLTEHEAHIIPGTFKLDSQEGRTYVVSADLEVT
jgi:hypothetical protein